MEIKKIVIAGAGTMGYSMAQIFAQFHYQVVVYDLNNQALETAQRHIKENVDILIKEKEITEQQGQTIISYLSYTTSKDCIKKAFYQEISQIVSSNCILATNTSGISINELASVVNKPQRFIGMHWFNPSHLILLIEIIKVDQTSDEVAQAIYQLSLKIHKKPVIVQKDVLGFAANRLQFAVLREALDLVEKGVISKEGIDDVMKYGLGFRYACLGPLEVADLGGLDTFYHISSYLMQDLCDSHDVPTILKQHFNNNEYGVKSQKGFYDYQNGKDLEAIANRDDKLLKLYNAFYQNK